MAIQEARCTNCGSINLIDTSEPRFRCLFCNAVVDTQEGLDVAQDAEGYEFPNEPQPETTDETAPASLYNQALKNKKPTAARPVQKKERPAPKEPTGPRARVEKIEMPAATISTAAKIKIAGVLVALLLITAAAVLPATMIRDAHRRDLEAAVDAVVPFDYVGEAAYSITSMGNHRFTVVASEDVTPATALEVFRAYSEQRAGVYGVNPEEASFSKVYGRIQVQVLHPGGGYEVSGLHGPEQLTDPSVVRTMD